jgi:ribonuclease VapC
VILDSSALVAIALDEPEREAFVRAIDGARIVGVGAPTLAEAGVVLAARTGADAGAMLSELVAAADAVVIDFGEAHWREALSAWSRFGKSRHPAALNFGDCLAYATASLAGQPLLAKGNGFAQTDLALVDVA